VIWVEKCTMTTYFQKSVKCVNCRTSSEHHLLGSTNASGSADLDLRPPEMRRSTMRAWLQECPRCRYIAPSLEGATGDLSIVASAAYRAILTDHRFRDLAKRFLAHSLFSIHSDPLSAGLDRLHAAWVCDDSRQTALATECRMMAAECFAKLVPFADSVEGLTHGAVMVDVLRRAGQFDWAAALCDELLVLQNAQDLLRQVLEYQGQRIAARDVGGYTIADAEKAVPK